MGDHRPKTNRAGGRFVTTIDHNQRAAQAARLRAKGWSYQRIADELGYADKSGAWVAVQRVLKETIAEPAEELRQMERDRLDHLAEAAWAVLERQHVTVSNGRIVSLDGAPLPDDGPVLQAIDRLLRISESRRKLEGLDAPSRVSVDAENLGNEISAILDRLTGPADDSTG